MPQYKYPVKGGAKWMTKFNYTDPKSGIVKTAYKRGFDSKREAKKYEDDFIDSLIAPEEDEVEVIKKVISQLQFKHGIDGINVNNKDNFNTNKTFK